MVLNLSSMPLKAWTASQPACLLSSVFSQDAIAMSWLAKAPDRAKQASASEACRCAEQCSMLHDCDRQADQQCSRSVAVTELTLDGDFTNKA